MAKFSQDSKMKDIVTNPAACAILEEYVPGASKHPQLKMAFGLSLKAIAGFPQAKISPQALVEMDAKLRALQ